MLVSVVICFFFFFKQKTAYEMRISDWSSDVCSSDLKGFLLNHIISELLPPREDGYLYANADPVTGQAAWYDLRVRIEKVAAGEIGRASCRERVCQYV